MCSNAAARIARLGAAIDELAAEVANAADDGPDRVATRLAALWAMMAELDPGLARRLRSYTSEEPGGPSAGPPSSAAQQDDSASGRPGGAP